MKEKGTGRREKESLVIAYLTRNLIRSQIKFGMTNVNRGITPNIKPYTLNITP